MKPKFTSYTVEPYGEEFAVYGHGVYERSSVLAGQARRKFMAFYVTPKAALADYPTAEVLDYSTREYRSGDLAENSGLPAEAPDWFSEADAGETW